MNGPGATSAFSAHPEPAVAAGECAGSLLDSGVQNPDLLVVAASAALADRLDDLGELLTTLVSPTTMVGVAAEFVLGGADLTHPCGLALLTWTSPEPGQVVRSVHLPADQLDSSDELQADTAVLFADPFSVPPQRLLAAADSPGVKHVSGGYVGTSNRRGGNRFLIDGCVVTDGIVGIAVDAPHATTFSTGGGALLGGTVTLSETSGHVLHSIDGTNALESYRTVLHDIGSELDPFDAVRHGVLHLAVAGRPGVLGETTTPAAATYRAAAGSTREHTRTVRIVDLTADDSGAGTLVTNEPLPSGTEAYFEVYSSWSSAADLGRQYHEQSRLRRDGDAALFIADRSGAAMAAGRDLGDLLGDMPAVGVVCSDVIARPGLGEAVTLTSGRADLVHFGAP